VECKAIRIRRPPGWLIWQTGHQPH
jgi:hypothetical protein